MKLIWISSLLAHAVLWTVLAAMAYTHAGRYTFASCWHIVTFYVPPLGFLILAIANLRLLASGKPG